MPQVAMSSFQVDGSDADRAVEMTTPTVDQTLARTTPSWLLNALPGYSSGDARVAWYSLLDRSGDRRVSFEVSGGSNDMRSSNAFLLFDTTQVSALTPTAGVAASSNRGLAGLSAPTVTTTIAWDGGAGGGGSGWLIAANWAGDVIPDSDDIAQFDVTGTNTTIGINLGAAVANNQQVGAIELLSTRNRTIGDSSNTSGTLTLNGATVNGVVNTILHNASTFTLTLQNAGGGSGTMDVALGNASDNVVNIDGSGGITITSLIKDGTGSRLTFNGNSTGILTIGGTTSNTYTGITLVRVGELDLAKTAGVNAVPGNLTIGDSAGAPGSATVKLINADQIADASDVTINSDGVLNLNGKNETIDGLGSISSTASVILGLGTLTVGSNSESVSSFAGVISGSGGLTKIGSGHQILSGANTYSGDTTIKAGELFLTSNGSLNASSVIRLGDTTGSNSALFLFGGAAGGKTLSNSLIVQSSAGGVRTLIGLATDGNTNTYSGTITLNTGLTLQSAASGATAATGQGILLLEGGSVDVGTSTLTVNSNLRGNNADTYSIQGIVRINEVLGSSQATGGGVFKEGSGTLILQGTSNTYTGTNAGALNNAAGTRIGGGILGIYGDGSLGLAPTNAANNVYFVAPTTTTNGDSIGPTLRAEVDNITLASTRNINIASGITARFDSNGFGLEIGGSINGAGNLNKIGAGFVDLRNANTYTGTTTVTAGLLVLSATNSLGGTSDITVNAGGTLLLSTPGLTDRIADAATMTLNGGTFATGGASEHGAANNDAGVGALTLQSSSIIDLGSGASILALANSSLLAASWNGTLSIYNWSGTMVTGNGTDQLYFGNNALGLTASQLAQISFYSDNGSTFLGIGSWGLDLDGEVVPVVPVPEPSTWIGAGLALAAMAWTQRRRLRRSY
jgi:autotransporter-associated beta strand protein